MQISSSYSYQNNLYTQNSQRSFENSHEAKTQGLHEDQNLKDDFDKKNENKAIKNPNELSREEEQQLHKLQARDQEVRAHEAAHIAAGAGVVTGGASFTYQKGPDGKQYAIGGEVPIDTSAENTPEKTIQKARKIKVAATAPANPSGKDLQIAAAASSMEMKAIMELAAQKMEEIQQKNGKNIYENSALKQDSSQKNLQENHNPLNIVA